MESSLLRSTESSTFSLSLIRRFAFFSLLNEVSACEPATIVIQIPSLLPTTTHCPHTQKYNRTYVVRAFKSVFLASLLKESDSRASPSLQLSHPPPPSLPLFHHKLQPPGYPNIKKNSPVFEFSDSAIKERNVISVLTYPLAKFLFGSEPGLAGGGRVCTPVSSFCYTAGPTTPLSLFFFLSPRRLPHPPLPPAQMSARAGQREEKMPILLYSIFQRGFARRRAAGRMGAPLSSLSPLLPQLPNGSTPGRT